MGKWTNLEYIMSENDLNMIDLVLTYLDATIVGVPLDGLMH